MHAKTEERLVDIVPVVAGVWGVVVRPSGVHSIASVPSLDLLDDVNFFKWELKCGSDDLHEFLFSYSGQTVSRDDICSLAAGAEVSVASTQPTPVKYGDTPENVKFKSIVCDNLKTKRMPMKWRDTKNKVDYGMYLMRHMESYVGEAVKVLQNGIVG
nr:uncharacterized protein LOC109189836 [Ipomoea trifida]